MKKEDNQWVEDLIAAIPDDLDTDHLAALLLTLASNYTPTGRETLTLLMTLPLTYTRGTILPLEVLKRMYISASEGVQFIIDQEAKAQKH